MSFCQALEMKNNCSFPENTEIKRFVRCHPESLTTETHNQFEYLLHHLPFLDPTKKSVFSQFPKFQQLPVSPLDFMILKLPATHYAMASDS